MAEEIVLKRAVSESDLAAVRTLCWAYRDFLMKLSAQDAAITETFYPAPKFAVLMDRIAQEHARPHGVILLALMDGSPVGCGMTHALDDQTCEIKRVFVTDTARGKGVAARLCNALEDQARKDGFDRIVLDTSRNLTPAQRLYEKLGFHSRGPYQKVPDDVLPALLFYEKTLIPGDG